MQPFPLLFSPFRKKELVRQVFFRVGGREIEGGINTLNFHFGGRANFTPNFEYTFLALNLYIDLLLADMTPLEWIYRSTCANLDTVQGCDQTHISQCSHAADII